MVACIHWSDCYRPYLAGLVVLFAIDATNRGEPSRCCRGFRSCHPSRCCRGNPALHWRTADVAMVPSPNSPRRVRVTLRVGEGQMTLLGTLRPKKLTKVCWMMCKSIASSSVSLSFIPPSDLGEGDADARIHRSMSEEHNLQDVKRSVGEFGDLMSRSLSNWGRIFGRAMQ